jgi:hypothetical protein
MNLVFAQPVGCGTDSRRAPFAPVAVYALATTVGGVATGGLLGLVGVASRSLAGSGVVAAVAITVALVATAAALRGRVAPLPQRHAQVPREWVNWRPAATAAAFGVMIGAGFLTYLHHATAYTAAAVVVLAPSLPLAVALGAVYGAARGLMLVVAWALSAGSATGGRGRVFAQFGVLGRPLTVLSVAAVAVAVIGSVQ